MTGIFFWDWWSKDKTTTTDSRDGYVEGTSGNDTMGVNYVDADNDKMDGNDAILPGETGDQDIVIGGAGDDIIHSGSGDDEVYGGGDNDTINAGTGDDVVFGDATRASAPAGSVSSSSDYNTSIEGGPAGQDMIEGGLGNDKIFGNGEDDTLKGQQGNDTLYGNSGDDSLEGGEGNDLMYGDNGDLNGSTGGSGQRESFEWDKAPDPDSSGAIDNGDDLSGGFSQNTGSVDVSFSIVGSAGHTETKFQTEQQKVHSITTDGPEADKYSSFESRLDSDDEAVAYQWAFSSGVGNVSFRINDIDADSKVTIKAYDANNNLVSIDVRTESGTHLTLTDEDGVSGKEVINHYGNDYDPDTDPDHSVLVNIAGPISKMVIAHEQEGHDASGVNVTDIYFDALEDTGAGEDGPVGDDTLVGGSGDDTMYGNAGDDSLEGGKGSDLMYGDNGPEGTSTGSGGREVFEWDKLNDPNGTGPIDNQDDLTANGGNLNTGSVNVAFTVTSASHDTTTVFETDDQKVHSITTDGTAADKNSSMASRTEDNGDFGKYQWAFSSEVENVSFRINDIDADSQVKIYAYNFSNEKLPVNVSTESGTHLTLSDEDGIGGNEVINHYKDDTGPDTDPDHSVLVNISGPISRLVVEHSQNGHDVSEINITDIYFDATGGSVPPAGDGPAGNDTLIGGSGDDSMFGEAGDDTFVVSSSTEGNGDVVTGGNGPDENADNDVLDLRGAGKVTITETADDTDAGATKGTVTFEDGKSLTFSQIETILTDPQNEAPNAVNDTATTDEDVPATNIDVLGNDTDPDGDPLSVTGATADNGSVTVNGDGTLNYTPNADFNGTDTITYTITDGSLTDTATVTVTVNPVNDAPVANPDTASTDEDTPVNNINVLGNDTDVDGDELSVTDATAANGSVLINADGTLNYTPNANFTGTDTITYTITDGDLTDTSTVTVTVGAVNDAPIAANDTATTDEDVPATNINVLGNDTDPDGDELTVTDATAANGSVLINADGTLNYTPNANFNGTDTITYTVTDGDLTDTATVTVTVNPVNDAPVANPDTASTDEDTPVNNINVLGNDTDVDGDELSVTEASALNGSVLINPDGTLNYTPNAGFDGTDTITYKITDGDLTDTSTVTVTVNDTIQPDGIVEGTDGDDTIDDAYDGDPNGDFVDNDDALPPFSGDDDIIYAYSGDDIVEAGSGDDTVYGGEGDDTIDGMSGDDLIYASDDDDTDVPPALDEEIFPGTPVDADPNNDLDVVSGGTGNDTIYTGDDRDLVSGDSGDDEIYSGIDNDEVYGGKGDDLIDDIQGADTIFGDSGDDTILAGIDTFSDYVGDDPNLPNPLFPGILSDPNTDDGRDYVDGGTGNDSIMTGDDADTIFGGSGEDTIHAGIDDDYVEGGAGADEITGGHGSDTIYGNSGDDLINAGDSALLYGQSPDDDPIDPDPVPENGRDYVEGGAGNDTILGQDDDDTLIGGSGHDSIDGGIDEDEIFGDSGDDTLLGGQAADSIEGGLGDDSIDGGSGDDTLLGGKGHDTITGGEGEDWIDGNSGDDSLTGTGKADTIYGSEGNDTLRGNRNDDELFGGSGDDSIDGGGENDTITGGAGADRMFGANDEDLFLGATAGDTIDGGSGGVDYDTLDLRGSAPAGGRFEVHYTSADKEDGYIEFYDASDDLNPVGTAQFEEIENIIPCFTPGTLIATPRGEVAVETLKVGDRVITRDNGIQEIRWMGQKDLAGRELLTKEHLQPVLIQKGSLGYGLPERDMLVSPNHRVLVNNDKTALYFEEREVLVAAKHLTGLAGVDRVETHRTSYIHFMFDQHEVVLSDGSWTESFQPGHQTLDGLGNSQRNEILELFPELKTEAGREDYHAARRTLKKHEAKLLTK